MMFNSKVNQDEFFKKWEKRRVIGKRKFSFIFGALAWGIPVALLVIVWIDIRGNKLQVGDLMDKRFLIQSMVQLIVFMLLGYYVGTQNWKISEQKYKRIKSLKENE